MDKKELFKKVEGRLYSYKNLDIEIKSIELEIESVQNEFLGCGSIEYTEKTCVTYNINRTVENEVVKREKELMRLNHMKVKKEIEKRKIENALTSLDDRETSFFELFYKNKEKNTIKYISYKLHISERHCKRLRRKVVYKIMDMLYPNLKNKELPLLKMMKV
ncbi:RNA polymerase sigma factor,phage transcriptional regulator, RinA family [[Clostridium] sordellii]|uniref:hypothetical protein n=1 Tax=Paraclostridium sordellii TaxID=1505 RepID=UPI0005427603|nr:hypothetical protein [Paeniclostridium sordellii]CEK35753.1 RNA polymerase sigma factor,phage transcriptional regulator, RinA family [[Clostridium] sordellii] [Paeniclostridium sordellii]